MKHLKKKTTTKNAAAVPADNSTHLDIYFLKSFKSWTAPVPITLPDYLVLLFQAMRQKIRESSKNSHDPGSNNDRLA